MRKKQIEEMAKIIGDNTEQDTMWSEIYDCANALYNADYRKASEVAEEIFAEIETEICNEMEKADDETIVFNYDGVVDRVLEKLKKKYTVTDTNVTTKESEKDE